MVQTVKNLPAKQNTWVWSLGWAIPWNRAWQPIPVFLLGESLWTEEPGGLQFMGLQRVRHDWVTFTFKESRITKGEGKSWCNRKRSLSRSHSGLGNLDPLTILYMVVYICQSHSPNLSHPPFPLLCPHVCFSTSASLFSLWKWLICTIFLDSTCMC